MITFVEFIALQKETQELYHFTNNAPQDDGVIS
jgi:hypothetical protein